MSIISAIPFMKLNYALSECSEIALYHVVKGKVIVKHVYTNREIKIHVYAKQQT